MPMFRLPIVLLLASAAPAWADIYKCVDHEQRVTYTSQNAKGCSKLDLGPLGQPAPPPATVGRLQPPAAGGAFPRVDAATQQKRDQGRQRILEAELAAEKRSLQDALSGTAGGAGKDSAAMHQRNIEALSRELQRLR